MTKTELVANLAERAHLAKADAAKVLDAWIDTVIDTLSRGDSIQVVGFGTFEVRNRAARTGHNPSTGEEIQIPACKVPAFKPGKTLKDAVNMTGKGKK